MRDAESRRRVALRVRIDYENIETALGERDRNVDGARRFTDAALLIRDGHNAGVFRRGEGRLLEALAKLHVVTKLPHERCFIERVLLLSHDAAPFAPIPHERVLVPL